MFENLLLNYEEAAAIILFGIGFTMLLFHQNLIKKLIGMNIMDTGVFLFLASMGYIEGRKAPIIVDTCGTGADGHRCLRVGHCYHAVPDDQAVQAVSHPEPG